jgi:hypothetical protein
MGKRNVRLAEERHQHSPPKATNHVGSCTSNAEREERTKRKGSGDV